MDALSKFLKQVSQSDKVRILSVLCEIRDPSTRNTLDIKKLVGKDLYRVRKGKFRIIFRMNGEYIDIVAVRLRNEKTYKDI
jgi:mRNA-degrading endonuclease RelE of RelBE toxin-antitoxin system